MSRLPSVALACVVALVGAGAAKAELVVRGTQDGMLALSPKGTPAVAYVLGTRLVVSTRGGQNRWRPVTAASVPLRSQVKAFRVGAQGAVALVQSANDKTLVVVRRRGAGWQRTQLAGGLSANVTLGWPGLILDGKGLPVIAYTRWNRATWNSHLFLVRVDARGHVRSQRITAEGFPQSFAAPPAAPVFVGGRIHVVETYGYRGVAATLEWYPDGRTWTGLGIDVGLGDFPVGPVLARSSNGMVYAAWTQSMLAFGAIPVTLAVRDRSREAISEILLERAFTTGLVLSRAGPEVAANEWVGGDDLDLEGGDRLWAGTVVSGAGRFELDGSIAGFAAAPGGGRDILLAGPDRLSWFRSPQTPSTRVSIQARAQPDGTVRIDGRVDGVGAGTVTLYRERPGAAREEIARQPLVDGSFSFVDQPTARPLFYRAVYTHPASGIPFGALLRREIE
jgi:hypothetical protein